ncbi:hypothetical protein ACWIDW_14225 [Microbacterium sp. NPDC055312]
MARDERLIRSIAFVAFMDNTVITVELPTITEDLGGGIAGQQWMINAYVVTPGSPILVAGAVSDALGRGVRSLSGRFGPPVFVTVRPIMMAFGPLLLLTVSADLNHWQRVLLGVIVFGAGLTVTVSPPTRAVPGERSGPASAINNAVARVSSLIIVALLVVIVGREIDVSGLRRPAVVTAALLCLGAFVSWIGIRAVVGPHSQTKTVLTAEPSTTSAIPMVVDIPRAHPRHA